MRTAIHEIPGIAEGIEYLQKHDRVFKSLPSYEGHPWPRFDPGFRGLVRIVLGQQVSIKAADAMWLKLCNKACITPEAIRSLAPEVLREAGLSRQKAGYITGLAHAATDGTLDFDEINKSSDEEVISRITSMKGFGVWSAQMYLIFALARPNVWPSGDLGIRTGLKKYLDLRENPGTEEAAVMGKSFNPFCTAAALLLWHMNSSGT